MTDRLSAERIAEIQAQAEEAERKRKSAADHNGHEVPLPKVSTAVETSPRVVQVDEVPEEKSTSSTTEPDSAVDGARFILEQPVEVPSIWGRGRQVLWAPGEALMVAGGQGLGKTTLAGQLVMGLLGLTLAVLGLPVSDLGCKILYFAMDRPRQIARAMNRQFTQADRAVLAERLIVWEGPPPRDLAANPALLARMAAYYDAGVVIVDSLKDAAVRLSEDAVGAQWNRARQHLLAQGRQLLELHHTTKRGPQGAPVTGVADVYGSTWLTSGCGSIVLLTGDPGDPIISFRHVKQPAEEVGPWRLLHDQDKGVLTIDHDVDLIELVKMTGSRRAYRTRCCSREVRDRKAESRAGGEDAAQARSARHQRATSACRRQSGWRRSQTAQRVVPNGEGPRVKQSRTNHTKHKTAGRAITHPITAGSNHASITSITPQHKTAGRAITHPITAITLIGNHVFPGPFRGPGT